MSMTTQCPSCGTRFRVTSQHLQSQQGLVRCGRCATVFDGFKALATLPASAPVASLSPGAVPPAPVVAPAAPVWNEAPVRASPLAAASSGAALRSTDHLPSQAPAARPLLADESQADATPVAKISVDQAAGMDVDLNVPAAPALSPTQTANVAAPVPGAEVVGENTPAQAPSAEAVNRVATKTVPPRAVAADGAAPAPRKRPLLWAAAALLMLATLGAQMVYWYRSELAASLPETRPLLAAACKYLHCSVDLPQRPRELTIEASDMQAADPANPGLVILTATLRNQGAITLGFPALDVVLTNTREHTVARRIFLPAEYLSERSDWRAGMAPRAEVTIRLNLDSGDLGAAGFRLDLMAAPAG